VGFNPHKVKRRRHIRHFYAACGWLLYLAGWVRVLPRTATVELWSFGLIFLAAVIFIHVGAAAWIGHNKRLASRGKRGLATRYMPPRFSADHLERPLRIDHAAYAASEVVVTVKGHAKLYVAADEVIGAIEVEALAAEMEEALEVGAD